MDFPSIIAKRRDGLKHSYEELKAVADGAASGVVPDYQLAAWLMAAVLRPITLDETVDLTRAMAESGERLDLSGLPKPWVDKHSTGGVGDKTTIVALPILAACGLTVVKMSGRGLGVTGGTVDKLSAIPGFRIDLSPAEMKEQAARIGLALTGQTPNLAPADKALYALRDVTGTVASIPLIVSSILSKKIAGGAEIIVLDVKQGSGAFMGDYEQASSLAMTLAEVGRRLGLGVRVAITGMESPLGAAVGNSLEIVEALDVLEGRELSEPAIEFRQLCVELTTHTLEACGHADAERDVRTALESGAAALAARRWIQAQGGPGTLDEVRATLPVAAVKRDVEAHRGGFLARIDALTVGQAVVDLGGGRKRKEDAIDLSVGVVLHVRPWGAVERGEPILTIHAATAEAAEAAELAIRRGIEIDDVDRGWRPLVRRVF